MDKSLVLNFEHRVCALMVVISEKDRLPPPVSNLLQAMRVPPNHRHDPSGLFPHFRRGKFDPLMAVRKVCTKVVDKVRFTVNVNNDYNFSSFYSEFSVYQGVSPIGSPEEKKPNHEVYSDEGRCTQERSCGSMGQVGEISLLSSQSQKFRILEVFW